MLNQELIDREYSFLGDDIFLNVSSVVMPPVRVQKAYLRDKIKDLGLPVVQAADEQVIEILKKYKVHCTMRGGYIRLGLDFYNTVAQMDIVSEALHEVDRIEH